MRRSKEIYGYITDVTEIADDGWYGNPAWADETRAARLRHHGGRRDRGEGHGDPGDAEGAAMTVVRPGDLSFRDFPGEPRRTHSETAGQGESTVREVVIEHVPSRSPHLHPHQRGDRLRGGGPGPGLAGRRLPPVGPGTWYRIPSGTPHATLAAPGERLSLVCFFPHDHFADNIEELDMHLEYPEEDVDD